MGNSRPSRTSVIQDYRFYTMSHREGLKKNRGKCDLYRTRGYLKREQTHRQTHGQTDISTIESIGPEGRCFENFILLVYILGMGNSTRTLQSSTFQNPVGAT